ncbi:hypothetical protein [Spiroplasma endosymbiont of Melieria omissa]|uniref:hypothetical protein n=1 Tax=Spiroplasma endosymbiont of Melieria omissa TaxID=3139324 RepID=UPI003CCB2619
MDKKTVVGIILIILGIVLAPVVLGIPLLIIGIINIVQGEVELEKEKDNSLKKELKENKQQIKNDKKIYYELNKIKIKVCKFCNKEILETDKVVNYKKDKWDNTYINKAHSSCYKSYRGINSHIAN